MSSDLLERVERPEYTGENRCWPCTAVNLLLAALLAALVGRRNRALGLLTLVGSLALVALRGYLVPGTPELTERYLPEPALALFGKADRPASVDDALAQHAADRASADDGATESDATTDDGGAVEDGAAGPGTTTDDEGAVEDGPDVSREAVEGLLERPMDEILEAFGVVEEGEDDLVLVGSFRETWEGHVDALADDAAARREAFADVVESSPDDVELEARDDGRRYGLLEGSSVHNWITEAAVCSDLAAHRTLSDPRWELLEPAERLAVLRGFRVFLTTCPECGGPVSATEDVVESCCGSWDVVAVECADCGSRVLELDAPDSPTGPGPDAADAKTGGFTR